MEVIGQQTRDEIANGEQLNLLSIFNFVMGGLNILGAFIMMAYTALFGFISNRLPHHGGEEAEVVFTIFTSVFGILAFFLLTVGVLLIISGFKLRKRTNRMFSLVMGVLTLPSFPFGTALGVFSIIVLSKPGVKEIYQKTQEALDEEQYGFKRDQF
jgi:heme/copper-type cytochrome/quinol oxidase subunit 2